MILKRFATAIQKQDWTTVLLEIAVVVVGIYLGVQASEWQESREDRNDEIAYLERIASDLETSVADTVLIAEFQERHAGYGALVLSALRACALEPRNQDEFASGIYLIGKHSQAPFITASIRELLSSGRMTIIRNTALRQTLVELLQTYEDHIFYITDVQLRLAPHVNYIDSVAPIVIDGPIGGGSNVSWDRLDADFDLLCSDRRFHTAVASSLNYTWDTTEALFAWEENLRDVQRQVFAELAILQN